MMWPINQIDLEFTDDEVVLIIIFNSEWNFDRLKADEDNDYIIYVANSDFHIKRFWVKTLVSDFKNKKIIFNDIVYGANFVKIYFIEG